MNIEASNTRNQSIEVLTFPRKHIPWESFLSLFGRSMRVAKLRTSSYQHMTTFTESSNNYIISNESVTVTFHNHSSAINGLDLGKMGVK